MDAQEPTKQAAQKPTPKWLLPVAIVVAVVVAIAAIVAIIRQAQNNAALNLPTEVIVTGSGFSPKSVEIKKGESITWINKDSTSHQIVAKDPQDSGVTAFDSHETLGQGDSYTYTFEKAGTYVYGDKVEPTRYKGTVIVK